MSVSAANCEDQADSKNDSLHLSPRPRCDDHLVFVNLAFSVAPGYGDKRTNRASTQLPGPRLAVEMTIGDIPPVQWAAALDQKKIGMRASELVEPCDTAYRRHRVPPVLHGAAGSNFAATLSRFAQSCSDARHDFCVTAVTSQKAPSPLR